MAEYELTPDEALLQKSDSGITSASGERLLHQDEGRKGL